MIKTWTLQHFKSVYDRIDLEMAPLTIFAGANSSGKSTIIQSLLLTTQSLQSPVDSRPVILNGHIVRLGTYDDIVSNKSSVQPITIGFELIPVTEEQKQSISRKYFAPAYLSNLSRRINSVNCQFSFSSKGPEEIKDSLQLQPRIEECTIKIKYKISERIGETDKFVEEEVAIRRSKKTIQERIAQLQLSTTDLQQADLEPLEFEVIKPSKIKRMRRYYFTPLKGKPAGATLRHFLPGRITIVFDAIAEQVAQITELLISPEGHRFPNFEISPETMEMLGTSLKDIMANVFQSFLHDLNKTDIDDKPKTFPLSARTKLEEILNSLNESLTFKFARHWDNLPVPIRRSLARQLSERRDEIENQLKIGRAPEYTIASSPVPDISESAVEYTQNFFSSRVKYLGPLRDEPKPVYPLAGATDSRDVGFRGEHTAAVLDVHRTTQIKYISTNNFSQGLPVFTYSNTQLLNAVLDWMSYMGVASDVSTSDKGKLGHELKVATSGEKALHDLTHVGVGVSQVLPILVLSLLADPGSTLIFEQPELHLHPRVQTRLADFFISMTLLKKQCIVETHSEYLINRLRYQTAISEGEELSKKVIMYFVEKKKGFSSYRPIKINRFGVIEDWPEGFFDENEENSTAILKAGMVKRKREKGQSDD